MYVKIYLCKQSNKCTFIVLYIYKVSLFYEHCDFTVIFNLKKCLNMTTAFNIYYLKQKSYLFSYNKYLKLQYTLFVYLIVLTNTE